MKVVLDVSGNSLAGFIKGNMEPGSTVITDGWSGFSSTGESGYIHIVPKKFQVADEKNRYLMFT